MNIFNKIKKVLSIFLSSLIILNISSIGSSARVKSRSRKISDKQKQIDDLKQKINEKKQNQKEQNELKKQLTKQIEILVEQTKPLQEQINKIRQDKIVLQNQINDLDRQINEATAKIQELNNQIEATKKQIEEKKQILKQHFKKIYIMLKTKPIETLLSSKDGCESFSDLIKLTTYTEKLSTIDKKLIDSYLENLNKLKDLVINEEQNKKNIENYKQQINVQYDNMFKQEQQLDSLIAIQHENMKTIQSNLKHIDINIKGIDDVLHNYENEVRRREQEVAENLKKIEEVTKMIIPSDPAQNPTPNPNQNKEQPKSNKNFIFPVTSPCYISQGFKKGHHGIDISTYGKANAIVASKGGTVVFAGSTGYGGGYGGYGNCVVINHGNGISTLYAHMSRLACRVNQKVNQGNTIGYVGRTGQANGVHCHFEVRVNGRKVNPMSYLK